MFVARVRTRARAGKLNQGIGIGTVVVGEGGSPLRVSPKRSHSELEAGQGPSQLTSHHTGGACTLENYELHYVLYYVVLPPFVKMHCIMKNKSIMNRQEST